MLPEDERHGTYAGAAAHHREKSKLCPPCRDAQQRYMRRRDKLRQMGRLSRLPLGEARYQRLLDARAHGYTYEAIADLLHVAPTTPHNWMRRGPAIQLPLEMLAKIDAAAFPQPVTAIGVLRRLQALTWLGYTAAEISRRIDVNEQSVFEALNGNRQVFHDRVRDAIVALFDELWDKPIYTLRGGSAQVTGGRRRAHNRAMAEGWLPPLAYDEIDDPTEKPAGRYQEHRPKTEIDEAVVMRLLDGQRVPCTTAERGEAMRRWKAAGKSERALCRLHGWQESRYGKGAAA